MAAAKAENKGTAVYRGATDTRTAAMVSTCDDVLLTVNCHCICSPCPNLMTSEPSTETAIFIPVDVQLSMHRKSVADVQKSPSSRAMAASGSEAFRDVFVTILRRRPLRRP